ncbi:RNA pseudouridylate synthase domain-containing protein 1 isoform X2 [Dasypus novemcinctus]|uniref:RNA pseudouridylate synthase domain-containing protein 1 isoform X2 n=1 Tax=Dasypus novemcinctus TaxID=9361 RepID=UPI00265FCD38|nr:RNA pseudouridylate synthase domain-containing protein 1 isoform X2 [Dasypus novemcinctus]
MEPGSVENLSIVYRSRDFLVVNKHWDVRIDSKAWRETLTLQKQLRHRFPELADPDTCYGFRFCHQLDFSTSGALCVALNKAAAGSAYRCFKERRVTKVYLALVRGHVQESRMTISYAIGRSSTEGRAHTMLREPEAEPHGAGGAGARAVRRGSGFQGAAAAAHRPHTSVARALQRHRTSRRGRPDVRPGHSPRGAALPHDAACTVPVRPHTGRARGGLHAGPLPAGPRRLLEPPRPRAPARPARPGPAGRPHGQGLQT